MSTNQRNVHFNIGVAGFLDHEDWTSAAHVKVTDILSAIKERVLAREHALYATAPKDIRFDFYTSPAFAGDFWPGFCHHWDMGDLCVVSSKCDSKSSDDQIFITSAAKHTIIASELKGVAHINSMIDWATCQIDIAFALWDGNETSHDGSTWSFIEHCKSNGIPCIWIDTNSLEKSFWFKSIYPEAFDRTVLWDYLDGFYLADESPQNPEEIRPQRYLFSRMWEKRAAHYEKRRKIEPVYDETKQSQGAYGKKVKTAKFEDRLLLSSHRLEKGAIGEKDDDMARANYEFLRQAFHDYEKTADAISPAIRGTLFCRTWVPLLSTIFLAVGFYVESIMRFLQWSLDIWGIVAGIGFLLGAFTFFYNRLPIKPHKKNLENYVFCRYVDEYLRVALHFLAYGMPVSERILNKAIRNVDDPVKQKGAIRVRRLLRMRTPTNVSIDAMASLHMVKHLNQFFDSQIEYQTVGRKLRFEGIHRRLYKAISILLWVNLVMLACRSLVQFVASILPQLGAWLASPPLTALNMAVGGKDGVDFARSFANMAALLITAWYDKYVRQRDMNHYSGYYRIAEKILGELRVYKAKTAEIARLLEEGGTVSYQRFRSLAEDTLESLIGELYQWCDQTIQN